MDLSIVIINYNTKNLTKNCIQSIIESIQYVSYEIIVVDNSSKQSERYEPLTEQKNIVRLFSNVANNGFGAACNFGAKRSNGDYLLFLNSDTLVKEDAIDKCIEYLKNHKNVGALGVRTLLPNGDLDHGCKRGFPTPASSLYYFMGLDKKYPKSKKYGAYRQTFVNEHQTSEVDAVSGSFMIVPKSVYKEVSGFDEDYFMYGEDIDLCYRIKSKDYSIVYFADAYIIHLRGQSGLSTKSDYVVYHFYDAMKIFYKKHYENKYNFFINKVVYAGIKLKYLISVKGKVFKKIN